MNGEEKEILHFIAIIPNETDFEKENFIDVRSPNPEDIAQLIVKELSKSNQITVASFGPRTVTSHSYLVGQVSVLDSLLHSFADAKIEVKVILRNSSRRRPSGSSEYYSIKRSNQIDILAKKIQNFPETDYIKVILSIQKYTIILLSLPPFIPFNSKIYMKYQINGWNALMNPSSLVHTRAFALLHFDPNLPTESAVLKFLPNEPREVGQPEEDSEKFEDAVTITEEDSDEYEVEYEDDDQVLSSNSKSKNKNRGQDQNSISDANSQQRENLFSPSPDGQQSAASSRRSRKSGRSRSRHSQASQRKDRNAQNQGKDVSANGEYDDQFEPDNTEYPKSNQNNDEYEEETNDRESTQSKSETKKGNKKVKQKKIIRKKKAKQTINVQQLLDTDGKNARNGESESSIPTESNFNDNYDEEEESLNTTEVQIHQFVSNLQLNIPVLTDTSVFSTLFQQLFYERWKSGILNRCRSDLSSLRKQIKERSTDEINGLRQLVSSRDMTKLIDLEERRMQKLESNTVEMIQKVMEKRLSSFSEVQQKSLLNNLQILCGDNVTFSRQLRKKRAETRQTIIELRVLQFSRMEKLQDYNKKVKELELAASAQARLDRAHAELDEVDHEKKKLEADREALLQQRDKVLAMLESKKLKIATGSKKK